MQTRRKIIQKLQVLETPILIARQDGKERKNSGRTWPAAKCKQTIAIDYNY